MTWNPSLIDGPVSIAIYGDPITDDEGHTYRPITGYVEGYHLNVAPEVAAGLDAWRIEPTSPERVFAGAETVFLRFADEAEARSALGAYWMEPEDAP
jgi:hypothetical protein